MSDDIEAQVCLKLQETECSIQLDKSAVRDNQALLLACIWLINDKKNCEKKFCHSLETFCPRENIFSNPKSHFNLEGIPIRNMIFCVTDGAPSMIGR